MTEYTAEETAAMLARHGFDSDVYDPEEIAENLTASTELNDTLDEMLASAEGHDPTAPDSGWAR